MAYLNLHSKHSDLFIYIFLSLWIKSQSRYSVVAECTVVQLFACVQGFGHRGLAILFLVPGGHFDKLDRLEWYQDSEEELLIVPLHVVLRVHLCVFVHMWKFKCGLQLHFVIVCYYVSFRGKGKYLKVPWIAAVSTLLLPSNVLNSYRLSVFRWTCSCSNLSSWTVLYMSQSWWTVKRKLPFLKWFLTVTFAFKCSIISLGYVYLWDKNCVGTCVCGNCYLVPQVQYF